MAKVIRLPDRDDMLHRLLSVCDIEHMQQKFYPFLLQHAGQEKVALGVVTAFAHAIHCYTQGRGLPALLVSSLPSSIPRFIDAIVDDPAVRQDAKELLDGYLKS